MSLGDRHLKVFVSSTMKELRPERMVIKQVLDQYAIPNFVFEDDVAASNRSPKEIYSEALEEVKVYIGIFWQKYGPHTIQEYRDARALGLSCLVYVKDSALDQRDPRLREFLEGFTGVDSLTFTQFSVPEDLGPEVMKSVIQWYDEQIKKRVEVRITQTEEKVMPAYLPCLCDRDFQETDLKMTVTAYFENRSSRPLMVVLPGPHREEHGLYMNRVEFDSLKKYVPLIKQRKRLKAIEIRKRVGTISTPTHVGEEIGELLQGQRMTPNDILDYVRRESIGVLLVIYKIRASECGGQYCQPLQTFLDYFAAFPTIPPNVLICAMICLQEDDKASSPMPWWTRVLRTGSQRTEPAGVFHATVCTLEQQYKDSAALRFARLPRLTSPVPGDVERWLGHEWVKPWVRRLIVQKEIDDLFGGNESLPMSDLSIKLTDLLDKQAS